MYAKNRVALTFLSNYESDDVAAVVLGPNSTALWIISPPDLQRLKDDLKNSKCTREQYRFEYSFYHFCVPCLFADVTLKVRYKYSVTRVTYSEKMSATISDEPSYVLKNDDPARIGLVAMLEGNNTDRIELPFLFPKFLKVCICDESIYMVKNSRNEKKLIKSSDPPKTY